MCPTCRISVASPITTAPSTHSSAPQLPAPRSPANILPPGLPAPCSPERASPHCLFPLHKAVAPMSLRIRPQCSGGHQALHGPASPPTLLAQSLSSGHASPSARRDHCPPDNLRLPLHLLQLFALMSLFPRSCPNLKLQQPLLLPLQAFFSP